MLKLEALVTTRTRTAAGFAAPTMVRGRSRAEAHWQSSAPATERKAGAASKNTKERAGVSETGETPPYSKIAAMTWCPEHVCTPVGRARRGGRALVTPARGSAKVRSAALAKWRNVPSC